MVFIPFMAFMQTPKRTPSRMTLQQHRDALQRVLAQHPDLTAKGFDYPRTPGFQERRAALASSVIEFQQAAGFLAQFRKRKTVSRRQDSATWARLATQDTGFRITNGTIIAAAVALGFVVKQIDWLCFAWLGIGRKVR
jgi:hypothetical protein